MDKITKLSQAIRLGATFRPQCFGNLFQATDDGLGSCAIGAALEATGMIDPETYCAQRKYDVDDANIILDLLARFHLCPVLHWNTTVKQIMALNDCTHSKSREYIADILEKRGL